MTHAGSANADRIRTLQAQLTEGQENTRNQLLEAIEGHMWFEFAVPKGNAPRKPRSLRATSGKQTRPTATPRA